jgi:5'-nucleotidase
MTGTFIAGSRALTVQGRQEIRHFFSGIRSRLQWGPEQLQLDPAYPIVPVGQQVDYDHLCGPGGDRELLRTAMNMEGLYRNLEPMPGAVDAALAMEDAGLDVFFCSTPFATHATCASEKLASIEEHLGARWVPRVILTHDKTLVKGSVLVDDKPGVHGAMEPEWTHLVFDQSYNRCLVDAPRLREWKDWEQAIYPLLHMAAV